MINSERIRKLETEVDRLRDNYNPKASDDFKMIATSEYGVDSIVRTPIVHIVNKYGSSVIFQQPGVERLFIFYYTLFKWFEPFVLGHEIGHLAMDHLNSGLEKQILEYEADYFSAKLNNLSLTKFQANRLLHTIAQNIWRPRSFNIVEEAKRLIDLGIPIEAIEAASRKV